MSIKENDVRQRKNRAVMLDRDGVLVEDVMYPHKPEHYKMLPGVVEGLKKLSKEYIFVIITNQSGIGRGIYKEEDMHNFNGILLKVLKKENIEIKKIYYCPHSPEQECGCRKPSNKFIKEAEAAFAIDPKRSWVIGDKPIDVEMGMNAGAGTIYMLTGQGRKRLPELQEKKLKPGFIAEDMNEAADYILGKDNDG
jgi:D-glycero-D-manno-heptose 1,7-bisphosphate phosphatase